MLRRILLLTLVLLAPPMMSAAAVGTAALEGFEAWKPGTNPLPAGWKLVDLSRKGRLRITTSRSKRPHIGKGALRIVSGNPQRFKAPGFVVKDIASSKDWNKYAGISFWVKGDGSRYYASIVLGTGKVGPMNNGYEALIPLSETKWHKVTLRWEDFVQNAPPWTRNKSTRITKQTLRLDPTKVTQIGFGHGRYFFDYDATYSMEIDEVRLEKSLPKRKLPERFSVGLSRTARLLKAGKPLKILALGDSIIWRGKRKSYAFHLGTKLKAKFKSEVSNCNRGIAGYTARGGAISLPRDIRAMPDPDLVLIFFGANDCKAAGLGVDPETFAAHLADLVDRIRIATGGKADVMILSGVPRGQRKGEPVSKIVKGAAMAAKQKQTAFYDSYPVFKSMPAKEHKKCCPDGLHFSATGQKKMAELVFARICKLVTR
jgi:lysophospholipase L1-like esterase